ncbi:DUF5395 domain-containing protein [Moorella sulfitireducens (nom. illeg.)]|uniref:DUF5395 domain-containing protein n=1 Tax=Neomoorella sulfitireducens TaxID=2972948 RepID=UPI0021ABC50D|nr:DUF5395 domain-containing protein [Moorella sulfitireducens]
MRADLEVKLSHDGREWIAGDANFEARGHTLVELDQNIKKVLQLSGKFQLYLLINRRPIVKM